MGFEIYSGNFYGHVIFEYFEVDKDFFGNAVALNVENIPIVPPKPEYSKSVNFIYSSNLMAGNIKKETVNL
jgi:hypothetical protein